MALAEADFIPPQIQLITPQPGVALPSGWKAVVHHDGRIYYQNDITHETSWKTPSNTITHQTQTYAQPQPMYTHTIIPSNHVAIDYDENEEDLPQRKIWHYSHIICLVVTILGIYDYYTDIKVATSWIKFPSYCSKSKFKCQYRWGEESVVFARAIGLFLCSSIGFIAGLIFKYKDAKMLYLLYKYPIKKKDLIENDSLQHRRLLCCGWIPLIVEDLFSLYATFVMWDWTYNVPGLTVLTTTSMFTSSISILFNSCLSCRYHHKLKKLRKYWCVRLFHCCWCLCLGLTAFIICILLLLSGRFAYETKPIAHIAQKYPQTDNISYDIFCDSYDPNKAEIYADPNVEIFGFDGNELMRYPWSLYPNCSGFDYDYLIMCTGNMNEIVINCILSWEYKYYINDECNDIYIADDDCNFDIELGMCGNYSIVCKNSFKFHDGDPQIWVCFDYCEE